MQPCSRIARSKGIEKVTINVIPVLTLECMLHAVGNITGAAVTVHPPPPRPPGAGPFKVNPCQRLKKSRTMNTNTHFTLGSLFRVHIILGGREECPRRARRADYPHERLCPINVVKEPDKSPES